MPTLRSVQQLSGYAALACLIAVTFLAFQGLAGFNNARFDPELLRDPYTLKILRFSLWQASLSTLVSLVVAWPLARILYRLNPTGTQQFLRLCLLAFVTPTLVVITSTMVLFGPQGLLREFLPAQWKLFGLNGILIAHVYLNFPLALRILLQSYQSLPLGSERLASQLKLSSWQRFRVLEWPQLRSSLLAVGTLIFILCFNSFAVVLALGGGPSATTFELAIYQALKYQFNLSEALTLSWVQFAIAGSLFALTALLSKIDWLGARRQMQGWQPDVHQILRKLGLVLYLCGWLVMLLPLFALLSSIEPTKLANLDYRVLLMSLGRSLLIALGATLTALLLALVLLPPQIEALKQHRPVKAALINWISTHHLVAPAMVLSTGIYIWLLSSGALKQWSTFWLVLLNALLVLPFLLTQLRTNSRAYQQQYGALIANLNLGLLVRSSIYLRYLKRPLMSAFALGLLLALGDVSIFAIFGSYDAPTLPWLIYSYAGSYRLGEASIASTLLLMICALLLLVLEKSHHQSKV